MCKKVILLAAFAFSFGLFVANELKAGDPDLVGCWKLDGDTTDSSGGNNGTVVGDPQWVTGYHGGALQFDGDDCVDLGELPDLPFGASARSLCGWAKPDALDTGYETIAAYGTGAKDQVMSIVTVNETLIGSAWGDEISSNVWVGGEWQHVTVTFDGATAYLYHNGVLVASQAKDWNLVLKEGFIGAQVAGPHAFFKGVIDDVCIFKRALTESDIQKVMKGVGLDAGEAGGPDPSDGATDVCRDVVLTWTPGELANTHNVYFGTTLDDVNNASVDNPLNVQISPGQDANTYDSGRLAFGETYYWRVDEVSAAPDNAVCRGSVWSFTVEPVAIAIKDVSVVASSAKDPNGLLHLVDGLGLDPNDLHGSDKDTMWLSDNEPNGAWLEFEFDKAYALHQILVWNHNTDLEVMAGYGAKDVLVQYSLDGSTWEDLASVLVEQAPGEDDSASAQAIDVAGTTTQWIRLMITSNYSPLGIQQFGLSEVRFLCIPTFAREPQPENSGADVAPQTVLSWRAGRQAALHDVYLNDDEQAVIDGTVPVETVTDPSYAVSLDLASTYYWRIDEVNDVETPSVWQGDLWSFSTTEFSVIDDFESYTNDSPDRVFQVWIDGLGFSPDEYFPNGHDGNGSGAIVGYDPFQGDIMEKTNVHGGGQALPLAYSNTTATYSEVVRTFGEAQDWTASGIKSLSLYFTGAPGNSGQLYVKINNVKVPYDGDAADIASEIWYPWNIDLSTVNADMSNVTTLAIGIEGAGAEGILYLDDIRLYPYAAELIIPTEPDAANLVARYALDGNANDSSGNGFHGQEEGTPTYSTGVAGQAMEFDGTDDWVDIGNHPTWPSGKAPRSISMWAMTYRVGSGYRLTAAYGKPGVGKVMCMGQNGTSLVAAGWGSEVALPRFWKVDEWHHICLTYDGTTARLYADGVEVASGAMNWNLELSQARIGCQVGGCAFWHGCIDDLCIYGRVLSAEEIAWMGGRRASTHKPF